MENEPSASISHYTIDELVNDGKKSKKEVIDYEDKSLEELNNMLKDRYYTRAFAYKPISDDLKSIIETYYNKFMNDYLKDKLFKDDYILYFNTKVRSGEDKLSHFLDLVFDVNLSKSPINKDQKINLFSRNIVCSIDFRITELFGNCSTAVFNNLTISQTLQHNVISLFAEANLKFVIELCKITNYSNLLYTVSSEHGTNKILEEKLISEDFKNIDSFKNKRGGDIKFYSKII